MTARLLNVRTVYYVLLSGRTCQVSIWKGIRFHSSSVCVCVDGCQQMMPAVGKGDEKVVEVGAARKMCADILLLVLSSIFPLFGWQRDTRTIIITAVHPRADTQMGGDCSTLNLALILKIEHWAILQTSIPHPIILLEEESPRAPYEVPPAVHRDLQSDEWGSVSFT